MRPRAIAIFGPTASGKSALALGLAERLGGEIVNADSRQVYRGVQVVTAGPILSDKIKIKHHLFDFIDLDKTYSAGRWAADAAGVLDDIIGRGKVPIIVGGTGFYLKTLLDGMGGVPEVENGRIVDVSRLDMDGLRAELAVCDPVLFKRLSDKGELANRQRLVRAISVFRETGTPLSTWQEMPGRPGYDADWVRVALNPSREVLAGRIEARWRALLAEGLLEEMRTLLDARPPIDESWPGMQGLAVGIWLAHVRGELGLEEAIAAATRRDVQYAKRQRTWLRGQFRADIEMEVGDVEAVVRRVG